MFSLVLTECHHLGESLICVAHSVVQVYNTGKLSKPSEWKESKSLTLSGSSSQ